MGISVQQECLMSRNEYNSQELKLSRWRNGNQTPPKFNLSAIVGKLLQSCVPHVKQALQLRELRTDMDLNYGFQAHSLHQKSHSAKGTMTDCTKAECQRNNESRKKAVNVNALNAPLVSHIQLFCLYPEASYFTISLGLGRWLRGLSTCSTSVRI